MLDTRTRLHAAMPADRRASSNEVSFSRCLPTPFVKKSSLGTKPITWRSGASPGRDETAHAAQRERILVNRSDGVKKNTGKLWTGLGTWST